MHRMFFYLSHDLMSISAKVNSIRSSLQGDITLGIHLISIATLLPRNPNDAFHFIRAGL